MDINFFVANHKPIFHRKYIKIQEIIANIGGLAKAFFLGMYIISFYFSTIKLNIIILNKIFNSDLNASKINLIKNKTASIIIQLFGNLKANDKLINNYINNNNTNKGINDISNVSLRKVEPNTTTKDLAIRKNLNEKTVNDKNNISALTSNKDNINNYKLKFSFFDILIKPCNRLFGCIKNRIKFMLYKKSENMLLDCLDKSYIVFKLEEFEKLKMIFFNKEQLTMFQFISKDICTVDERTTLYSNISKLKQFVRNKDEILKIYY
jgi:hypothetical protein